MSPGLERIWQVARQQKKEKFTTLLHHIFICGKSRRGKFLLTRKTRRDRMRAKLQAIKQELRQRRHQPIPVQGKWLRQVIKGYFNYHAVPTNSQAMATFRFLVTEFWQRSLRRRSQKDGMTWERITRLASDWLPKPLIPHPWPEQRFAVKHPRWEPYALIGPVRFCAGRAQSSGRRYATAEGVAFEAKPTADRTWHGFPIPWESVPVAIKNNWLRSGAVKSRQTKKYFRFDKNDIHWAMITDDR